MAKKNENKKVTANTTNKEEKVMKEFKKFYGKNMIVEYAFVKEGEETVVDACIYLKANKTNSRHLMSTEQFFELRFKEQLDEFAQNCAIEHVKEYSAKYGIDEDLSYTNLWQSHRYLCSHTDETKREQKIIKKFIGSKMECNGIFYTTDSSDRRRCIEVATPDTKVTKAAAALGKEIVMFDIGNLYDFPKLGTDKMFNHMIDTFIDPNFGTKLTQEEKTKFRKMGITKKSVMFMLLFGFTDVATGKTYYVLNSSASKIRAGGQFLMVEGLGNNSSWIENWKYIEYVLRPACFGLLYDQYKGVLEQMKGKPQLKIETSFALGLSSSLSVDEIAANKRGEKYRDIVNNFNIKVVDDIEVEIASPIVLPDYDSDLVKNHPELKAVSFKKVDSGRKLNVVDGTSLITLRAQVEKLFAVGRITVLDRIAFYKIYNKCHSVDDLYKNLWMRDFVIEVVVDSQERYGRGVKGMVVVCVWMDFDPICKEQGIDIITFKGNIKYQTDKSQPQIINYTHKYEPFKKRDKFNYQFIQASNITAEELLAGAKAEIDKILEIRKDVKKTLVKMGASRNIKNLEDIQNQKLSAIIEADPNFIHDPYVVGKFDELCTKWVQEIGTGKIRANGQSIHIVHDPYYCFMKAMVQIAEEVGADASEYKEFESALNAGEIYCNHYTGECGLWRNPMIHKSEAQRAKGVDVDYLWMYEGLCVLNPKDLICPSLGGADTDGDKVYLTFSHFGEFEKAMVDAIDMSGYIISDDESLKPVVAPANIMERCYTYANVCQASPVGQITNYASAWTDFQKNISDIRSYNWIERILIRDRYSTGMAIDYPKTDITHAGPDGDLFPEYLKSMWKPMWLWKLSVYKGKPSSYKKKLPRYVFEDPKNKWLVNPDGVQPEILETGSEVDEQGNVKEYVVIDTRYYGKSPMAQLDKYASAILESFKAEKEDDKKVYPLLANLRTLLSDEEKAGFELIKNDVIALEKFYRNECKGIMDDKAYLASISTIGEDSKDEFNAKFEMLYDSMRKSLSSLIDYSNGVNEAVVAYACYYASNFRKNKNGENEKISGTRSFPWSCAYEYMMELLYRGNNQKSVFVLPDEEIYSVSVIDGYLYINDEKRRPVQLEDGEYSIFTIEDKPYIYASNKALDLPEAKEVVTDGFTGYINFGGFQRYNQKVDALQMEELMKNNLFDITLTGGRYALSINGLVYSYFNECADAFVGKKCKLNGITSLRTAKGVLRQYLNASITVVGNSDTQISTVETSVASADYVYINPMDDPDYYAE